MPAHRSETPSYRAMHKRLDRARGLAKYLFCECGMMAKEWSYIGGDPDELTDTQGKYSAKEEYYVPRCAKCHRSKDVNSIKTTCAQGHAWTKENIYVRSGGRQMCGVCNKIRTQAKNDARRNA